MSRNIRCGLWALISRRIARCLIAGAGNPVASVQGQPVQQPGRRGTTLRLLLALPVAVLLSFSIAAQDSELYQREAGSDVVGKIRPADHPTNMVRIPAEHQKTIEANLQRFVAIVLRNPALRPPVGFDLMASTLAYAPLQPVSLRAPLAYQVDGMIYRYGYLPAIQKVDLIPGPAWDGFYVRANDISTVFDGLERWPLDERGLTYVEPQEIRKVAGFPQYTPGVVVIKRNPRPIWVPVSREWALQRQLDQRRKNMNSIAESAKAAGAANPAGILEQWLGERPARQREMETSYAEMKRSNPEYAEKIRANFFEMEKRVEKTMRETAERQKAAPRRYDARFAAERSREEQCIREIEGELARLSPAERAAPAHISLTALNPKELPTRSSCSGIVEADFPQSRRLVTENPDYFDKGLSPSAIQLILVDFRLLELYGKSPRLRPRYYERIRDGLDYSALAAMLQK